MYRDLKYLYSIVPRLIYMKVIPSCILLTGLLCSSLTARGTLEDCSIVLMDNVLTFSNDRIAVEYYWNNGDIGLKSFTNKSSGHQWKVPITESESRQEAGAVYRDSSELHVYQVLGDPFRPDHLVGEVTVFRDYFEIRKKFRLYPGLAALALDLFLKKGLEGDSNGINHPEETFDEILVFPGKQWKYESIRFLDRTDQNNNLVQLDQHYGFYRPTRVHGNILIASDLSSLERIFIIKECPLGESQLEYPGFDFETKWGEIRVANMGALYSEVLPGQWFRCYGMVLGSGGTSEHTTMWNIREYMKRLRRRDQIADEMIMLNTWGDRGQDGRINEDFTLKELQLGNRLGITHLQLDDGWQQGLSKNSRSADGKLWDQWSREDWNPHPSRFPSGLSPIANAAQQLGIEMGLWFHPSNAGSYAAWEQDVDIILDLHSRFGIRAVKIDGMELSDKNADLRMREMFNLISEKTGGRIIFNVDVTAGRRGGYFYLNEYGNIFLENRYTDWGNYYPHWTLRNLWQLSRYVPPEILQIEFLNGWRNPHKYDDADPTRPSTLPFEYLFAVTLAGQPLAWMELSGLPEEAFGIGPAIKTYQGIMQDLHAGYIFPIGEEPNGNSWTGFQSIRDEKSGYFLVYREGNVKKLMKIKTFLKPGSIVSLKRILGSGNDMICITDEENGIPFELSDTFSYALYSYKIKNE